MRNSLRFPRRRRSRDGRSSWSRSSVRSCEKSLGSIPEEQPYIVEDETNFGGISSKQQPRRGPVAAPAADGSASEGSGSRGLMSMPGLFKKVSNLVKQPPTTITLISPPDSSEELVENDDQNRRKASPPQRAFGNNINSQSRRKQKQKKPVLATTEERDDEAVVDNTSRQQKRTLTVETREGVEERRGTTTKAVAAADNDPPESRLGRFLRATSDRDRGPVPHSSAEQISITSSTATAPTRNSSNRHVAFQSEAHENTNSSRSSSTGGPAVKPSNDEQTEDHQHHYSMFSSPFSFEGWGSFTSPFSFSTPKKSNKTADNSEIWSACKHGDLDEVRDIVSRSPAIVQQSRDGKSPLYYACQGGHDDVAKFLLESGATDPDNLILSSIGFHNPKIRELLRKYDTSPPIKAASSRSVCSSRSSKKKLRHSLGSSSVRSSKSSRSGRRSSSRLKDEKWSKKPSLGSSSVMSSKSSRSGRRSSSRLTDEKPGAKPSSFRVPDAPRHKTTTERGSRAVRRTSTTEQQQSVHTPSTSPSKRSSKNGTSGAKPTGSVRSSRRKSRQSAYKAEEKKLSSKQKINLPEEISSVVQEERKAMTPVAAAAKSSSSTKKNMISGAASVRAISSRRRKKAAQNLDSKKKKVKEKDSASSNRRTFFSGASVASSVRRRRKVPGTYEKQSSRKPPLSTTDTEGKVGSMFSKSNNPEDEEKKAVVATVQPDKELHHSDEGGSVAHKIATAPPEKSEERKEETTSGVKSSLTKRINSTKKSEEEKVETTPQTESSLLKRSNAAAISKKNEERTEEATSGVKSSLLKRGNAAVPPEKREERKEETISDVESSLPDLSKRPVEKLKDVRIDYDQAEERGVGGNSKSNYVTAEDEVVTESASVEVSLPDQDPTEDASGFVEDVQEKKYVQKQEADSPSLRSPFLSSSSRKSNAGRSGKKSLLPPRIPGYPSTLKKLTSASSVASTSSKASVQGKEAAENIPKSSLSVDSAKSKESRQIDGKMSGENPQESNDVSGLSTCPPHPAGEALLSSSCSEHSSSAMAYPKIDEDSHDGLSNSCETQMRMRIKSTSLLASSPLSKKSKDSSSDEKREESSRSKRSVSNRASQSASLDEAVSTTMDSLDANNSVSSRSSEELVKKCSSEIITPTASQLHTSLSVQSTQRRCSSTSKEDNHPAAIGGITILSPLSATSLTAPSQCSNPRNRLPSSIGGIKILPSLSTQSAASSSLYNESNKQDDPEFTTNESTNSMKGDETLVESAERSVDLVEQPTVVQTQENKAELKEEKVSPSEIESKEMTWMEHFFGLSSKTESTVKDLLVETQAPISSHTPMNTTPMNTIPESKEEFVVCGGECPEGALAICPKSHSALNVQIPDLPSDPWKTVSEEAQEKNAAKNEKSGSDKSSTPSTLSPLKIVIPRNWAQKIVEPHPSEKSCDTGKTKGWMHKLFRGGASSPGQEDGFVLQGLLAAAQSSSPAKVSLKIEPEDNVSMTESHIFSGEKIARDEDQIASDVSPAAGLAGDDTSMLEGKPAWSEKIERVLSDLSKPVPSDLQERQTPSGEKGSAAVVPTGDDTSILSRKSAWSEQIERVLSDLSKPVPSDLQGSLSPTGEKGSPAVVPTSDDTSMLSGKSAWPEQIERVLSDLTKPVLSDLQESTSPSGEKAISRDVSSGLQASPNERNDTSRAVTSELEASTAGIHSMISLLNKPFAGNSSTEITTIAENPSQEICSETAFNAKEDSIKQALVSEVSQSTESTMPKSPVAHPVAGHMSNAPNSIESISASLKATVSNALISASLPSTPMYDSSRHTKPTSKQAFDMKKQSRVLDSASLPNSPKAESSGCIKQASKEGTGTKKHGRRMIKSLIKKVLTRESSKKQAEPVAQSSGPALRDCDIPDDFEKDLYDKCKEIIEKAALDVSCSAQTTQKKREACSLPAGEPEVQQIVPSRVSSTKEEPEIPQQQAPSEVLDADKKSQEMEKLSSSGEEAKTSHQIVPTHQITPTEAHNTREAPTSFQNIVGPNEVMDRSASLETSNDLQQFVSNEPSIEKLEAPEDDEDLKIIELISSSEVSVKGAKAANNHVPASQEIKIIQQILSEASNPPKEECSNVFGQYEDAPSRTDYGNCGEGEVTSNPFVLSTIPDHDGIEAEPRIDGSVASGSEVSSATPFREKEESFFSEESGIKVNVLRSPSSKSTHAQSNITREKNRNRDRKHSDDPFEGIANKVSKSTNASDTVSEIREELWTDENESGTDEDAMHYIATSTGSVDRVAKDERGRYEVVAKDYSRKDRTGINHRRPNSTRSPHSRRGYWTPKKLSSSRSWVPPRHHPRSRSPPHHSRRRRNDETSYASSTTSVSRSRNRRWSRSFLSKHGSSRSPSPGRSTQRARSRSQSQPGNDGEMHYQEQKSRHSSKRNQRSNYRENGQLPPRYEDVRRQSPSPPHDRRSSPSEAIDDKNRRSRSPSPGRGLEKTQPLKSLAEKPHRSLSEKTPRVSSPRKKIVEVESYQEDGAVEDSESTSSSRSESKFRGGKKKSGTRSAAGSRKSKRRSNSPKKEGWRSPSKTKPSPLLTPKEKSPKKRLPPKSPRKVDLRVVTGAEVDSEASERFLPPQSDKFEGIRSKFGTRTIDSEDRFQPPQSDKFEGIRSKFGTRTIDSEGMDQRESMTVSFEDTEASGTIGTVETDTSGGRRVTNANTSCDDTATFSSETLATAETGPTRGSSRRGEDSSYYDMEGGETSFEWLSKFMWKTCGNLTGIRA